MTEWCSCNKLKEAEEKAAKWDALTRDIRKLQNALFLSCLKVKALSGTCPLDMEDKAPCDCETVCTSNTDMSECWYEFFIKEAE